MMMVTETRERRKKFGARNSFLFLLLYSLIFLLFCFLTLLQFLSSSSHPLLLLSIPRNLFSLNPSLLYKCNAMLLTLLNFLLLSYNFPFSSQYRHHHHPLVLHPLSFFFLAIPSRFPPLHPSISFTLNPDTWEKDGNKKYKERRKRIA